MPSPLRVRIAAAAAALFCVSPAAGPASAAPAVVTVTPGTGDRGAVYRGDQLVPFLRAAAAGRVDVAGIGDSNQIFTGGVGHDGGMEAAWAAAAGLYGSGVLPFAAVDGWQTAGTWATAGAPFASGPVPSQFAGTVLPGSGFPGTAASVAPGSTVTADGSRVALALSGSPAWGAATEQRWHYTYGTFGGADAGSFGPSARTPGTGNVVASKVVATAGPAGGLVDDYLPIPGGSGDLWLEPTTLFSRPVAGGFFANWQRVESAARDRGVAYSTLLYQGGLSTRAAAEALRDAPDAALAEWARQATRLQRVPAAEQRLMVQVLQGANDQADAAPAVGSAAPTNTPAGYAANLAAVIGRLRQVWSAGGRDPAKLNFVVGAYHGRPADQVPAYAAFEQAAMGVADATAGVTVLRGTRLFSYRTMADNGWYFGGPGSTDYPHLSDAGYYGVGRITVNQMMGLARDGAGRSAVSSLRVLLSEDVTALATDDLALTDLSTGRALSPLDFTLFYDPSTRLAEWTFPGLDGGVLPAGRYRLTVDAPGMATPYTSTFEAAAVPEPAGAAAALALCAAGLLARRRRRA